METMQTTSVWMFTRNDQLLREGRQRPYPVYHTGSPHNPWMVGNHYLIALRQSFPSSRDNPAG
jgi:hypothetical protein